MSQCAIIGDELLAARCGTIALDAGLSVAVVATMHPDVRAWADEHRIPWIRSEGNPDGLAAALAPHDFDVLLSIANLRVLPDDVLDQAGIAINFHDGPLPGYAGLNVTTWALLAGESEHAVTWHVMTRDVDGGEIVAVERFDISPDDTALSLNARCFEAGEASFPKVVAGLLGELSTTPQPAGERRVYRRVERPIVVFDPQAEPVAFERGVRAVAVGHRIVNTVGIGRVVHAGRALVVGNARLAAASGAAPGTVRLDGDDLCIATVGDDVVLDLETPDGRPLHGSAALTALGLAAGDTLAAATTVAARLSEYDPGLARHEAAWRARLAHTRHAVAASATPLAPTPTADSHVAALDLPSGTDAADVVAAVAAWSWRLADGAAIALGLTDPAARATIAAVAPTAQPAIVTLAIDDSTTLAALREAAADEIAAATKHGPLLSDLFGRDPALRGAGIRPDVVIELDADDADDVPAAGVLAFRVAADGSRARVAGAFDQASVDRFAAQVSTFVGALGAAPDTAVARVTMLAPSERTLIDAVNTTDRGYDTGATIDRLVREQIARTPDAPAVSHRGTTITYSDLDARVGALTGALVEAGVRHRDLVGVAVPRGIDMLVAVLAAHRCGAAYVPLDPGYPADRLRHMVTDSGLRTVVAEAGTSATWLDGVTIVRPDDAGAATPPASAHADDLAYVIYTSGSTGLPKGVMLEHRNVVNFFVAMDDVIEHDPPGVWLAVTSLSFDISVLELLWTLTRGFHVVIQDDRSAHAQLAAAEATATVATPDRPIEMSMFYFAAGESAAHDGYRLLLESARFADQHGFVAVWTPERHFHAFGGAYPNPSVAGAAIAAITSRVAIRAGSVVAPLHSPLRIAEEWAVVDNLSHGRVGISFAAGWQPNDFVLNPGAYATARDSLPATIDTIQRLWRGEAVEMPGHDGRMIPTTTLPRPVQPELPVWLTSAGSTATFERAGTLGVNLLTHLLGQSIDQLTDNIAAYRAAWNAAGHAGHGTVTLMLHTYLHADADEALRAAREPMKSYLRTATGLLKDMASAFPTFAGRKDADEAFKSLTDDELDQLLDFAASRYLDGSGLFGTPDDAVAMIASCAHAGVDEVSCLIDFGVDTDAVLASLPLLAGVRERVSNGPSPDEHAGAQASETTSFAQLVERYRPTHLQCTPSLATMLAADPDDRDALATIGHLMLGGEALPVAFAAELRDLLPGRFTNMYGPTETTIWSLVHEIDAVTGSSVPIGKPIANNTIAVLDQRGEPVPVGVFGELHIGGDGVARGYHDRPQLTDERFVSRPMLGRTYATGDLARIRPDGIVEFAGRNDHQVKIRGHRIELGEIETVLDSHHDVTQAVVVAERPDIGDPRLIAFVTTPHGVTSVDHLRSYVAATLPDAMVPSRVIRVDMFPLTPNGKTDRNRLLTDVLSSVSTDAGGEVATDAGEFDDDTEQIIATIWVDALQRPVGRDQNFFDLGGNSLLAVAVFRRIGEATGARLSLTDVFRYPTVRTFAAHLARQSDPVGISGDVGASSTGTAAQPASPSRGTDRGAMRRQARQRSAGEGNAPS